MTLPTILVTAFFVCALCWSIKGQTPLLWLARACMVANTAIVLLFEVQATAARTFCSQVRARYRANQYAEAPRVPEALAVQLEGE